VDKDQATPVPVITLGNEHYQHKSYGRIFTPAFKVLQWVSLTADEAAPVVEAPAPAPAGRRRRAVA
jgi:hypothetical protein